MVAGRSREAGLAADGTGAAEQAASASGLRGAPPHDGLPMVRLAPAPMRPLPPLGAAASEGAVGAGGTGSRASDVAQTSDAQLRLNALRARILACARPQ